MDHGHRPRRDPDDWLNLFPELLELLGEVPIETLVSQTLARFPELADDPQHRANFRQALQVIATDIVTELDPKGRDAVEALAHAFEEEPFGRRQWVERRSRTTHRDRRPRRPPVD